MNSFRQIEKVVAGQATSDGAGVKLTRMLGTAQLAHLDPFLMLDCFESDKPDDYLAGFPEHPHRGFQTVTYILNGRMRHKDNAGHESVIEAAQEKARMLASKPIRIVRGGSKAPRAATSLWHPL